MGDDNSNKDYVDDNCNDGDNNYNDGDDDDENYNDGAYVKIYDNNHHKVWRARQPSHRSRARYAQNRGG